MSSLQINLCSNTLRSSVKETVQCLIIFINSQMTAYLCINPEFTDYRAAHYFSSEGL